MVDDARTCVYQQSWMCRFGQGLKKKARRDMRPAPYPASGLPDGGFGLHSEKQLCDSAQQAVILLKGRGFAEIQPLSHSLCNKQMQFRYCVHLGMLPTHCTQCPGGGMGSRKDKQRICEFGWGHTHRGTMPTRSVHTLIVSDSETMPVVNISEHRLATAQSSIAELMCKIPDLW